MWEPRCLTTYGPLRPIPGRAASTIIFADKLYIKVIAVFPKPGLRILHLEFSDN
jgi:hypothetical protein